MQPHFLYRARIVAASALAGSAVTGILLHVALKFDPHLPGALIGGMIAIMNWSRITPT